MSERQQVKTMSNDHIELTIARYLHANPDFFDRHPDLLEALRIPHPCRPAISLIERQLLRLREQNAELRRQFQELVAVARDNDSLSRRMQRLALELIEADGLDELLHGIKRVLRDEFGADYTAVRLAARPVEAALAREEEFVPAQRLVLFESVLRTARPSCGRIGQERAGCLFDRATRAQVRSAALVPLRGGGWQGLLAVGSDDENRFYPGMGTLFLTRMGELIVRALQPYLLPPQAEVKP